MNDNSRAIQVNPSRSSGLPFNGIMSIPKESELKEQRKISAEKIKNTCTCYRLENSRWRKQPLSYKYQKTRYKRLLERFDEYIEDDMV